MRKTLHCLMAVCMFHVTTFLLLSELKAGSDQSLQAPLLSEGGESEEMTQPARLSDFRSVFTQPSGGRNMFRGGGLDEEDKKLLGLEDAESTAAKAAGWETDSDFDVELDAEVQRQYHRKGGGAGKDSKPVDFSKVREDLQRINPDQREGGDSEDSESLTAFNERVQRDLELAGSGSTNIVVGSDTRPVVEVARVPTLQEILSFFKKSNGKGVDASTLSKAEKKLVTYIQSTARAEKKANLKSPETLNAIINLCLKCMGKKLCFHNLDADEQKTYRHIQEAMQSPFVSPAIKVRTRLQRKE